jgi:hypothetical protein
MAALGDFYKVWANYLPKSPFPYLALAVLKQQMLKTASLSEPNVVN